MKLKDYIATEKSIERNGIGFRIVHIPGDDEQYPCARVMCFSTTPSNGNGTNGVRLPYEGNIPYPGFHAFLTKQNVEMIVSLLTEESKTNGIQFIKDDELTKRQGHDVLIFYKMSVLRSPVVV